MLLLFAPAQTAKVRRLSTPPDSSTEVTPLPLLRLALCGAAGTLVYVFGFAAAYGIAGGVEKPLLHFGYITGGAAGSTIGYIGAITALFALYAVAVVLSTNVAASRGGFLVVVAFAGISAMALIPMYPVFSLDVFYYMSADRIWSVYRENPFVVPPLQAAHDPFFPYTSWGHYTLPYGPLWPWVASLTGSFGHGQLVPTLLAFKGLGALGYLACVPLVWWAAAGIVPDRRVLATCIFAWNPLVLIELAGGAHNDSVALVPTILALGFWVRRHDLGTGATLAVAFALKATVSVVAVGLLWSSVQRAVQDRQLPRWVLQTVLPGAGVVGLSWLPFWTDRSGSGLAREAEQHYQSLTAVLVAVLPSGDSTVPQRLIQVGLLAAFILFVARQSHDLAAPDVTGLRAVWRIVVFYFLVVGPFFSAWYIVWPTTVAALSADRHITWLNGLLSAGALAAYVVQFVIGPMAVGAPTAVLTLAAIATAFGPFLIGAAVQARRGEPAVRRHPLRTAPRETPV